MMLYSLLLVTALILPVTAEAGFKASSFRKEAKRGDNYWNAGSALDSRFETAWMVNPEQKNEGQWIEMDTPAGETDKLSIVVGWDQDDNTFGDYARIKKARVEAWTTEPGSDDKQVLEHEVDFEDKRGWQTVDIPDAKMGGEFGGGRVRITVLEVYPGKDYPNLAVSEVRTLLKEFPAETMQITTYPEEAEDGRGPNFMEDTKESTCWGAPAGVTSSQFKFTAAGYGLSSIQLKPAGKPYARPKTVELEANDMIIEHVMEDSSDWQSLLLPVVVGYTGSAWGTITVKIKDAYEGDKGLGICEIKVNAATIEDF